MAQSADVLNFLSTVEQELADSQEVYLVLYTDGTGFVCDENGDVFEFDNIDEAIADPENGIYEVDSSESADENYDDDSEEMENEDDYDYDYDVDQQSYDGSEFNMDDLDNNSLSPEELGDDPGSYDETDGVDIGDDPNS